MPPVRKEDSMLPPLSILEDSAMVSCYCGALQNEVRNLAAIHLKRRSSRSRAPQSSYGRDLYQQWLRGIATIPGLHRHLRARTHQGRLWALLPCLDHLRRSPLGKG